MSLMSCVEASVHVSQVIAVATLFVVSVMSLLDSSLHPVIIMSMSLLLPLVTLIPTRALLWSSLRLLVFSYILTPVLVSLANPISSDTLAIASALLLLLHVLTYDFFSRSPSRIHHPTSVSCGVLASLLLSSRMPSSLHAFACITAGLTLFAVFPHAVLLLPSRGHTYLAVVLPIASVVLFRVNSMASQFFPRAWMMLALVYVVVSMVAPVLFWRIQRWKHVFHGQWTEAIVEEAHLK